MKNYKILLVALLMLFCSCENYSSLEKNKTVNDKSIEESVANSQNISPKVVSLISQLATMKADTLDCSAEIYWKIIKAGEVSIPFLIESLTDTTMTNIYNKCKQSNLNVGEVSFFALGEIADFPAYLVTNMRFDELYPAGCWSFYDYIFSNGNKKNYQQMVKEFYAKSTYMSKGYDESELSDCHKFYDIKGKLRLKK